MYSAFVFLFFFSFFYFNTGCWETCSCVIISRLFHETTGSQDFGPASMWENSRAEALGVLALVSSEPLCEYGRNASANPVRSCPFQPFITKHHSNETAAIGSPTQARGQQTSPGVVEELNKEVKKKKPQQVSQMEI